MKIYLKYVVIVYVVVKLKVSHNIYIYQKDKQYILILFRVHIAPLESSCSTVPGTPHPPTMTHQPGRVTTVSQGV